MTLANSASKSGDSTSSALPLATASKRRAEGPCQSEADTSVFVSATSLTRPFFRPYRFHLRLDFLRGHWHAGLGSNLAHDLEEVPRAGFRSQFACDEGGEALGVQQTLRLRLGSDGIRQFEFKRDAHDAQNMTAARSFCQPAVPGAGVPERAARVAYQHSAIGASGRRGTAVRAGWAGGRHGRYDEPLRPPRGRGDRFGAAYRKCRPPTRVRPPAHGWQASGLRDGRTHAPVRDRGSSAHNAASFFRPSGLERLCRMLPTVELAGYSRRSVTGLRSRDDRRGLPLQCYRQESRILERVLGAALRAWRLGVKLLCVAALGRGVECCNAWTGDAGRLAVSLAGDGAPPFEPWRSRRVP